MISITNKDDSGSEKMLHFALCNSLGQYRSRLYFIKGGIHVGNLLLQFNTKILIGYDGELIRQAH